MVITVGSENETASVIEPARMGEVELEGMAAVVGQLQDLPPARGIKMSMLPILKDFAYAHADEVAEWVCI